MDLQFIATNQKLEISRFIKERVLTIHAENNLQLKIQIGILHQPFKRSTR